MKKIVIQTEQENKEVVVIKSKDDLLELMKSNVVYAVVQGSTPELLIWDMGNFYLQGLGYTGSRVMTLNGVIGAGYSLCAQPHSEIVGLALS